MNEIEICTVASVTGSPQHVRAVKVTPGIQAALTLT